MRKKIFTGFIVGLISNALGVMACTLIIALIKNTTFSDTWLRYAQTDGLWMVLSLGALPNLPVFFEFLRRKQEYEARGVLMVTIITALTTYFMYFQ
ncbi:MAG: hypothetical protein P8O93_00425 [Flavobacteriaceae bacterium]|jgi:hypothetical protein|nr:hypothetical protein [Flavobacteriaceae bacterium]MDG1062895.1 hypothetical protein [Flavobacteriaceae bacterium]MDG1961689.1 hypothetical protein [Flavobacteriaceae bacterium]